MKYKILYDSNIFLSQRAGGISRYHYELFKGMKALGNKTNIAGKFIKNKYLLSDSQYKKLFIKDSSAIFKALNEMSVKRKLKKESLYDIFHPSMAYPYLLNNLPEKKKMVFTIHDMIIEKKTLEHAACKWDMAKRADKIIAVSQATKNDIIDIFGIDGSKIEVVYHGSSLDTQMAVKFPSPLPDKYLLYVGNRGDYKNFDRFVSAIRNLLKNDAELYLVCVGSKVFSEKENETFSEMGIKDKILNFIQIEDNHLAYIYCKATAFVFPSLFEGFGIPILEAWNCNTPVILSDNACFTEVAAEGAYYFDPLSEESIENSVRTVLGSDETRNLLIQRGLNRLNLYSWNRAVEQTDKVYKSLL